MVRSIVRPVRKPGLCPFTKQRRTAFRFGSYLPRNTACFSSDNHLMVKPSGLHSQAWPSCHGTSSAVPRSRSQYQPLVYHHGSMARFPQAGQLNDPHDLEISGERLPGPARARGETSPQGEFRTWPEIKNTHLNQPTATKRILRERRRGYSLRNPSDIPLLARRPKIRSFGKHSPGGRRSWKGLEGKPPPGSLVLPNTTAEGNRVVPRIPRGPVRPCAGG
jgi:hypothetical protein